MHVLRQPAACVRSSRVCRGPDRRPAAHATARSCARSTARLRTLDARDLADHRRREGGCARGDHGRPGQRGHRRRRPTSCSRPPTSSRSGSSTPQNVWHCAPGVEPLGEGRRSAPRRACSRLASRLLVDSGRSRMTGGATCIRACRSRRSSSSGPSEPRGSSGSRSSPTSSGRSCERLGVRGERRLERDRPDVACPRRHAGDRLVEEIARTVLDPVPHTTPLRRDVAGHLTKDQRLRRLVEDVLVGAGLSEAFTWSLVAEDPHPGAIRVPDPLTADQAILRTTLIGGLSRPQR